LPVEQVGDGCGEPLERWYRDAAVLATFDFDPLASDWSTTH
jgi:hypothetical protein